MIKQIQLRGISRTPSDRMSEDGGLSESLNMYLDTAENAPALVPKDVTEKFDLPENRTNSNILYIHTTSSFQNIIEEEDGEIRFRNQTLFSMNEGEQICSITHLGNSLILSTNLSMYSALFDGEQYDVIGDTIKLLPLSITTQTRGTKSVNIDEKEYFESHTGQVIQLPQSYYMYDVDWNEYDDKTKENVLAQPRQLSTILREQLRINTEGNELYPYFIRYRVRFYDGSSLSSVPYLIGAKNTRGFSDIKANFYYSGNFDENDSQEWRGTARYTATGYFETFAPHIKLLADEKIIKQKGKIVVGIDIYRTSIVKLNLNSLTVSNREDKSDNNRDWVTATWHLGGILEDIESALTAESVYHLIQSYDLTDDKQINKLIEGITIENVLTETELESREKLLENDTIESFKIVPQNLSVYNNKLIASDISAIMNSGPVSFTSSYDKDLDETKWYILFRSFYNGQTIYSASKNEHGDLFITGNEPYGWFAHPDKNCTFVEVGNSKGEYIKIPMKEHPTLPISYAFLGNKNLSSYMKVDADSLNKLLIYIASPNDSYSLDNKLFVSLIDNPFTFPLEGRYTIGTRKVLKTAVATTALSQGQFGQFPLYVFTEDGIWAMETAADGSFVSQKPLSREVCINPDSICSIDNAVVFVTDKAVMMIQGSQVMNISPYMNGKHYKPNDSALNIIRNQEGFDTLIGPISNGDPFMSFMKDTKVAYDYTGQRLIFISPSNKGFQYVYKIDTQTWHKIAFSGFDLDSPLNSYPECLIQGTDGQQTKIYSLSTVLDASTQQDTAKGILITRPFDLGMPDVYKSITSIKVRGDYDKGNVKFILQGSDDGRTFYTLSSLRGKSWKMFRLFILADLEPTERISWIDVDFEPRYQNKLR